MRNVKSLIGPRSMDNYVDSVDHTKVHGKSIRTHPKIDYRIRRTLSSHFYAESSVACMMRDNQSLPHPADMLDVF
jgi:hypothetical protein